VSRSRTVDRRWKAVRNDFRRRGLSQAEFSRRRQVSLHSFQRHLYQPRPSHPTPSDDRSSAGASHPFLPVTILPEPIPPITTSPAHLELVLPKGRRIAVTPGFDPQTLRRHIAVVEGRPCSH
jgi:hypothetical protein